MTGRFRPLQRRKVNNPMKSKVAAAVLAVLALAPVLLGTSPARAEEISPPGPHCAVEAYPIDSVPIDTPEPVCFDTVYEVEEYISSASPVGRAATSSVAIGTIYENDQYGGLSLTYFAGSGCYGVTYGYPTLPSSWYSEISSAKGASNCWISLYAGDSYTAGAVLCPPNCATLSGTFNDRVRSLVFRPTGSA